MKARKQEPRYVVCVSNAGYRVSLVVRRIYQVVPDRDACYVTLGFVHSQFIPVDGRLKDYIAVPKSNAYQSLLPSGSVEIGNVVVPTDRFVLAAIAILIAAAVKGAGA